jgi:hypothetical protein
MSRYVSAKVWKCESGHTHITKMNRVTEVWCPYCKQAGKNSLMKESGTRRFRANPKVSA